MRLVPANTSTAAYRRVYFDLRATDGLTTATSEAGGQPQISTDGAAWTNTGIGTLTAIGNGRYYADLTQAAVATAGSQIQTRYKSANTVETPGDAVCVVAYDPYDSVRLGLSSLPAATPATTGGLPVIGTGANAISTDGAGNINANLTLWRGTQPNTLTSSRVDVTVGAMQASVLTATAIASDAITSTKMDATVGAEIADAVWDEATTGHTTSGTFGEQCKTDIDAILVDTGTTLDGRIPAALTSNGNLKADVQEIYGNAILASTWAAMLSGTPGGTLTCDIDGSVRGSVGSLDTQAKADVNAECLDVIFTDTISQLAQAQPSATPTVAQAIMLLYMALRNAGTTTSNQLTIANSAGTVICKATLSDNGTTFTKAALAAGP